MYLQNFKKIYQTYKQYINYYKNRFALILIFNKLFVLLFNSNFVVFLLGKFRCDVCGKYYQQKSTLYRHVKYECGKGNQFQCPYCEKSTRQKYDIKLHVLKKHFEFSLEFETFYYKNM